ncbi:MAG TPA: nuclear transport factor 2 family protein [Prosthecobacter sp.]|nr:nuclear transport factor 2 family protein [Prosthecobacter sp.]
MKLPSSLPVLLFLLATATAFTAEDKQLAAVRAADDARVAAMTKADGAKLNELLSDDLRYAHSSGTIDSKTSLIDALTSGRTKYTGIDYEERSFTFPAPGIALMSGRARVQVTSAKGAVDMMLAYLAVWREEKGQWRFLAWQSCKLPPPDTAK